MEKKLQIDITPLTLQEHRKILANLNQFWLSKSDYMRPLHHPLFSLLFNNYSCVLKLENEITSYIYAARNKNKIFIHIIATKPACYRKGYARFLLKKIEEKAKKENIKSIWCYIVKNNHASEKFFKSNGFIIRKQIKINSDEERILLKKQIE